MSRTPLHAWLRRTFATLDSARRLHLPAGEVHEQFEQARSARFQQRMQRREFLGLAAAAAVWPLGCQRAGQRGDSLRPDDTVPIGIEGSQHSGHRPVVVVGAGIAGLTAAYRLKQAGVPVRLFEAQNRVGGRIFSSRGLFADGQFAELGAELINSDHKHMRQLAAELGLELDDFETDDPTVHPELFIVGGQKRTGAELLGEFAPVAEGVARDLSRLDPRPGSGEYDLQVLRELDALSVAEWLDLHDIRGAARAMIEAGFTSEFGLDCEDQSSLNFLTMMGTDPSSVDLLSESDERWRIRGGNDLITQSLGRALEGHIDTGTALEAVEQLSGGALRLSFQRSGAAMEVDCDHAILCVPLTKLRELEMRVPLPPLQQRAIRELRFGMNTKLMVGFSSRVWRHMHQSNGSLFSDQGFQTAWETSRLQDGPAGILTNFTGGRAAVAIGDGTAAQRAAELVAQWEQVFPGLAQARGENPEARFHWPSHPWTRGSYMCCAPGQWAELREAVGLPNGGLYFAGEHCSDEKQGYMEGGCETGDLAAHEILAQLRKS